jgi:hypothetical protein
LSAAACIDAFTGPSAMTGQGTLGVGGATGPGKAANAGYQAVERLGHFGFTTAIIWFASLLWPTLAIIGLLASIFAPALTGRGSRIAAATISSAMTGLALFFFLHGWVGIRLWV